MSVLGKNPVIVLLIDEGAALSEGRPYIDARLLSGMSSNRRRGMDLSESDSDDEAPRPRMVDVSDPADETNGGRSYRQNYANGPLASRRTSRPGSAAAAAT